MRLKIDFRASVCVEGDSLEDIRNKFMSMDLILTDNDETNGICGLEYDETLYAEDADTYDDLTSEFKKILDE